MNIINFDKEANIAPYTLPEAGPSEEQFLRKKIQEKISDLDLVFIPTSAYELFCLTKSDILQNLSNVNKNFKDADNGLLSDKSVASYIKQDKAAISGLLDRFNKVNSLSEIKKAHLQINNSLIDILSEKFNKKYLLGVPVKVNRIRSDQIQIFIKSNIVDISKTDFLSKISKKIFDKTPKLFQESVYSKIVEA